jgi:hypothetical protein
MLWRGASALVTLALIIYFGYVIASLAVLIALPPRYTAPQPQYTVTSAMFAQALLLYQLLWLSSHYPWISGLLVVVFFGYAADMIIKGRKRRKRGTGSGQTPAAAPLDPDVQRTLDRLRQDPNLLAVFAPLLRAEFVLVLSDGMQGDLNKCCGPQRWWQVGLSTVQLRAAHGSFLFGMVLALVGAFAPK